MTALHWLRFQRYQSSGVGIENTRGAGIQRGVDGEDEHGLVISATTNDARLPPHNTPHGEEALSRQRTCAVRYAFSNHEVESPCLCRAHPSRRPQRAGSSSDNGEAVTQG